MSKTKPKISQYAQEWTIGHRARVLYLHYGPALLFQTCIIYDSLDKKVYDGPTYAKAWQSMMVKNKILPARKPEDFALTQYRVDWCAHQIAARAKRLRTAPHPDSGPEPLHR